MKLRTLSLERSRQAYQNLTDNAKEVSLRLEQKNQDLLEKQDYEIQVATLNERNRIAREIHDSVGHLLSRSILQLGALMAVYRQPPALNAQLDTLKSTLSQAMDSLSGKASTTSTTNPSTSTPSCKPCAGALISALSPCNRLRRHGAENEILPDRHRPGGPCQYYAPFQRHRRVCFRGGVPRLYQMVVKDNGTKQGAGDKAGIGLKNMEERVSLFHGNLTVSRKNGFRLFIHHTKGP